MGTNKKLIYPVAKVCFDAAYKGLALLQRASFLYHREYCDKALAT